MAPAAGNAVVAITSRLLRISRDNAIVKIINAQLWTQLWMTVDISTRSVDRVGQFGG